MNNQELTAKVHSAMYAQCRKRGYAAPVDVLMDLGVLPKQKYEDWRFGKVDYLERVCNVNLHKLSTIMHEMRVYAKKAGLKPSFCYYKRWGVKKKGGQGHPPVRRGTGPRWRPPPAPGPPAAGRPRPEVTCRCMHR